jgi:lipoate-protein ligase A
LRRFFYFSQSTDAYRNLAVDEYFLDTLEEDAFVLYIYINANSVIIGRKQNAWKECNVAKMEADGVKLVRRVSGGGAVYHDTGNVNFSFIAGGKLYDYRRQLDMVLSTVRMLGIDAAFSGRNDLTAGGRKFSGNAFASRRGIRLHHGTLLVDTDLSKLTEYLNVPEQKIKSKGIESVRSRVCNLREFNEELDADAVIGALREAYRQHYGPFVTLDGSSLDEGKVRALYEKHSSWEWRMGMAPSFDYETENRFPWGGIQLCLSMKDGIIVNVDLYTDAMDTELPGTVEKALKGVPFRPDLMAERLVSVSGDEYIKEIAEYLRSLPI